MSSADRTAEARIRDVAVQLFGERGIRATTIRDVARVADVSPALVMHHFGSKEGLRAACDDWVLGQIVTEKSDAIDGDLNAGITSALSRLASSPPWPAISAHRSPRVAPVPIGSSTACAMSPR